MVACLANGILFSDDAGASWAGKTPPSPGGPDRRTRTLSEAPLPPDARLVSLSPDYGRDGTIWLAASDGLWLSEDDGASWQRFAAPGALASLAPSPRYAQDDILLAGTSDQGVHASLSAGKSWFPLSQGLASSSTFALALATSGEQELTILNATARGLWQGRLMVRPRAFSLAQGLDGYSGATDTYLHQWSPQQRNGGQGKMVIRGDGADRPLLRFGLTSEDDTLKPGISRVLSASLELFVNWGGPVDTTADLYPVLRAWDEAEASWQDAQGGVPWSAPGCDGASLDRGSLPAASKVIRGADAYVRFDVRDLVAGWLLDPASNHGMLLVGRDAPGGSQYDLLSSEQGDLPKRPRLNLELVHAMDAPRPTPTATWTASPTPADTGTPTATGTATPSPTSSWTPTSTPTETSQGTSIHLPLALCGTT